MSGVGQPRAPLTDSSASAWAQLPDALLHIEFERLGWEAVAQLNSINCSVLTRRKVLACSHGC